MAADETNPSNWRGTATDPITLMHTLLLAILAMHVIIFIEALDRYRAAWS